MRYFAIFGLFAFLSGCAASPYWYPDDSQCGTVQQVVTVPHDQLQKLSPTNRTVRYGAWVQPLGLILLSDAMTSDEKACVLAHERKHAECWNHEAWARYKINCGE